MRDTFQSERYDVIAFGAHPDDLEVVLGGTAAKLARSGMTVLFVDIADYTALSAHVGEEVLFALMDELYELLIREVHRL